MDDWRPSASLSALRRRAAALAAVRDFFAAREVWEVETPILGAAGTTDPNIDSFHTDYTGPQAPASGRLWLQTSPEFHMKRLLAAGSGSIYQICKAFRQGEAGRLHNPEFTLVEWYRVGYDHWQLMEEVAALCARLCGPRPLRYLSYAEAFAAAGAPDPLAAPRADLREYALAQGVADDRLTLSHDGWLDLIASQCVSPGLGQGAYTFLHSFPASQAALARLDPADGRVAQRFELFIDGVEIANGFNELADAAEQARRLEQEAAVRDAQEGAVPPVDRRLLQALATGLPQVAGVALGLDRLLQIALGAEALAQVMAFPVERA